MSLYGTGFAVGLSQLTGLKFRADKPHTACKICGAVFQTDLDRRVMSTVDGFIAEQNRKKWSHKHAASHSENEHRSLKLSGRFCTAEAAHKFVAYGIISATDATLDPEYAAALYESSPIPTNDSEE